MAKDLSVTKKECKVRLEKGISFVELGWEYDESARERMADTVEDKLSSWHYCFMIASQGRRAYFNCTREKFKIRY